MAYVTYEICFIDSVYCCDDGYAHGLAASHSANANDDINTSQNEVAPVVVTQIVDADTPSSLQDSSGIKNSVQENGTQITHTQTDKNLAQKSIIKNKAAPIETQPVKAQLKLSQMVI